MRIGTRAGFSIALFGLLHFLSVSGLGASVALAQVQVSGQSADNVFEAMLSETGGVVPYPIETLVSRLRERAGHSLNGLFFPSSRSLQRRFASFATPRLILTLNSDDLNRLVSGPVEPHRYSRATAPVLYVGYSERAHQLEVISWNQTRGRFEFLVVSNYAQGQTPRVTRPERSLCISCHQAEGPIFAHGPWNEVTGPARDRLLQIHGNNLYGVSIYRPFPSRGHSQTEFEADLRRFEGVDGEPTSASSFDGGVRFSNDMITARRACERVCESSPECWRLIIANSLGRPTDEPREAQYNARLQEIAASRWPEDEFERPSSALLDRDPVAPLERGGYGFSFRGSRYTRLRRADLRAGFDDRPVAEIVDEAIRSGRDLAFEEAISGSNFFNNHDATPLTRRNRDLANPRNPRSAVRIPRAGAGNYLRRFAHICAPFSSEERTRIETSGSLYAGTVITNFVEVLSRPCMSRLFSNSAPPNMHAVATALVAYSRGERERRDGCAAVEALGSNVLAPGSSDSIGDVGQVQASADNDASPVRCSTAQSACDPVGRVAQTQIQNLNRAAHASEILNQYCARCHQSGNEFELPVLPLGNLRALTRYRGRTGGSVEEFIQSGQMPPRAQMPESERQELLRYLREMRGN